ncbi:unnamed protein product [Dimorphilus gyrociliatus]|uniref:Dynein axonemal light chain 1 n=1 Tax=Dimorphilus gyrociliatus TaxID=2664684 RepID=A0A7I8V8V1_9ANNE|nr:unnamed protein product [Dimorphilus gyrociliatus]
MSKSTTIREALGKLAEKTHGKKLSDITDVLLNAQYPPIEKMDANLSQLTACSKLSLSTNCIEKISNLHGLRNLRILSLGRNQIKSLSGVEAVGETLQELWISYNLIEKLKGVGNLKKLQVLYINHNLVKDLTEVQRLADVLSLRELTMIGNPIEEKHSNEGDWRDLISQKLHQIKQLDSIPLIRMDN